MLQLFSDYNIFSEISNADKKTHMKKLLSCNLKLNCNLEILEKIQQYVSELHDNDIDIIYAVPFPYLTYTKRLFHKAEVFAQDISQFESGAQTGEVTAAMLRDLDVTGTIIGHSERRQLLSETKETLTNKIDRAVAQQLQIIFCIGESLEERNNNQTLTVIEDQLRVILPYLGKTIIMIAYEPVWAIGTGLTPKNDQIFTVANFIEKKLLIHHNQPIHILYGGSVNDKNAAQLSQVKSITGFLVGGCSSTKGIVEVGMTLE